MVRLRRLTLVCTGVVAAFFAATMVLPLTTMGDPAYDIPMLRGRWYGGFQVFPVHLLAIALTSAMAVRQRSIRVALACGLLVACLYAILSEEGRFIRYGDLIDPHDVSMRRLFRARLATSGLSVAAFALLWRGGPGKQGEGPQGTT